MSECVCVWSSALDPAGELPALFQIPYSWIWGEKRTGRKVEVKEKKREGKGRERGSKKRWN